MVIGATGGADDRISVRVLWNPRNSADAASAHCERRIVRK